MSCSLCRLPFTPSTISVAPRWPPQGVLSDKQLVYMKYGQAMGKHIIGLVINVEFFDNNVFALRNEPGAVPLVIHTVWEIEGKTFVALHTHCALILRHRLDVSSDSDEHLLECTLLDQIIGAPADGVHAGRFPGVNYEGVLGIGPDYRVDIESLWSAGPSEGLANFDWHKWKKRGLDWTAARPDVFPRFRPTVASARLSSVGPPPEATKDIITTQPLDVLHVFLPYLSNESFVNFLSTCRTLRHHALTTFQPHARKRVIDLGWALALQSEYAAFLKRNPPSPSPPTDASDADTSTTASADGDVPAPYTSQLEMAHAQYSPMDADWSLYLSHVHRSASMRARRWVWALAEELARVYRANRAMGSYADVETIDEDGKKVVAKSKARLAWEATVGQQLSMRAMLTGQMSMEEMRSRFQRV